MDRIHNFSAGPSTLPMEVLQAASEACLEYNNKGMAVMEMSHRSKEIMALFDETINNILELAGLSSDDYSVLFLGGGASHQFAMVPMNFLSNSADYIDTGRWADKAIIEAKKVGKVNIAGSSSEDNYTYLPKELNLDPNADYVHLTTNNTVCGTQYQEIPNTGNVPLVADMSSDIFSRNLDFSKFSLIYAGAQKNLGPAGVTMVIINKKWAAEKAKSDNMTLLKYKTHIEKDTMFNTPPVFPVYVVNETLKWIKNKGGLSGIEKINNEKANMIYDAIDNSNGFYKGSVSEKSDRSKMNITFNLETEELEAKFLEEAAARNMSGLKGHRSVGGVRASIYNACPVESVEALVNLMKDFKAKS